MLIDAHVHIFKSMAGISNGMPITSERYGRMRNGNDLIQFLPPSFENSNSTAETLIAYMDWQKVDKAVLLANGLYGYHNDYTAHIAKANPDRFRAIALVDIQKGKAAADELELLHKNGLNGLKIEVNSSFQCQSGRKLDDVALEPVWEYCHASGEPVFLHLFRPDDYPACKRLLKKFPALRLVFCHLGAEPVLHSMPVFEDFMDFIKHGENLMTDTSSIFYCLPGEYPEEYPFPVSNGLIERFCNTAGAEKMLYGSDYPGTLGFATYKQLIDQVRLHCSLSAGALDMIMGKNAEKLLWK